MSHGSPSYDLDVAELLRRRENKGWTQRDLADACKAAGQPFHYSRISMYESGKAVPRPKNLVAIATVLDCQPDDLKVKKAAA